MFPSKILLIDDAPEIHRLVGHFLKKTDSQLFHALNGAEGLKLAIEERPNIVIIDYDMPDMNGLDVLKRLNQRAEFESTQAVFLTAADNPDLLTQAFDAGAVDFLRKPIVGAEFIARIRSLVRNQELNVHLKQLLFSDRLTGLPNREGFLQYLEYLQKQDIPPPYSLIAIGLDSLKDVFDLYGFRFGDKLVTSLTNRIKQAVHVYQRESLLARSVLVSRLSQDEFVLLLSDDVDDEAVKRLINNIHSLFAAPIEVEERLINTACSIGYVIGSRKDRNIDILFRNANIAMQHARSLGAGQVIAFDESMQSSLQRKMFIENELHTAIERNELFLVYQPIIDLSSGKVRSTEALIRWKHPLQGFIPPDQFIPVAEKSQIIHPIGDWVFETACSQLKKWVLKLGNNAPETMSINVARPQLTDLRIIERFVNIARSYEILPSQIQLEITETTVMEDTRLSLEVLHQMHRAGFRIALDDFGSGYSSLSCLTEFPLNCIKIDRSITKNIESDIFSARLFEMIIRLAKITSATVVAEGVETLQQANTIRDWGGALAQGYFFSKPQSADQITDFLISHPQSITFKDLQLSVLGSAI